MVDLCHEFGSPRVYTLLLNRFLENYICRLNDFLVFLVFVPGYSGRILLQLVKCFLMCLRLCVYKCIYVCIYVCIHL